MTTLLSSSLAGASSSSQPLNVGIAQSWVNNLHLFILHVPYMPSYMFTIPLFISPLGPFPWPPELYTAANSNSSFVCPTDTSRRPNLYSSLCPSVLFPVGSKLKAHCFQILKPAAWSSSLLVSLIPYSQFFIKSCWLNVPNVRRSWPPITAFPVTTQISNTIMSDLGYFNHFPTNLPIYSLPSMANVAESLFKQKSLLQL